MRKTQETQRVWVCLLLFVKEHIYLYGFTVYLYGALVASRSPVAPSTLCISAPR